MGELQAVGSPRETAGNLIPPTTRLASRDAVRAIAAISDQIASGIAVTGRTILATGESLCGLCYRAPVFCLLFTGSRAVKLPYLANAADDIAISDGRHFTSTDKGTRA